MISAPGTSSDPGFITKGKAENNTLRQRELEGMSHIHPAGAWPVTRILATTTHAQHLAWDTCTAVLHFVRVGNRRQLKHVFALRNS